MSVNNGNLLFSSDWEIDQLAATSSVAVSSGTTAIYTVNTDVTLPIFVVQFKPSGSSYWYQPGYSSTDATLANLFSFSCYLYSGALYITTASAGTARYFVWSDKVNN